MKWIVISWLLSACYFVPYPYQAYALFGVFAWMACVPTWWENRGAKRRRPNRYWVEYEYDDRDDTYYDWDVRGPH